jgi:hypothetical protein
VLAQEVRTNYLPGTDVSKHHADKRVTIGHGRLGRDGRMPMATSLTIDVGTLVLEMYAAAAKRQVEE